MNRKWDTLCETVQESLWTCFWDSTEQAMGNHRPLREQENWIYWWHAHVLDVLLDGYERTGDRKYLTRFEQEYHGTYHKNGDTFLHNWYDDMEWMALALLRAYDLTGEAAYKEQVLFIWEDIKTAWNGYCGGGMAWKKDQPDYKNTPANAPAAILAFRLYTRFGRQEDLEWGDKIFHWNAENLMDPETCFVWDGMNREGDKKIDKDWKFTYCQGVMLQAALEYSQIHEEEQFTCLAVKIARQAVSELTGPDGIFCYEGKDDCGLFRGIYFRYLYELLRALSLQDALEETVYMNADAAASAMNREGLIGGDWHAGMQSDTADEIDLAQHLSGIMVLEMAAKLQRHNKEVNRRSIE